MNKRSRLLAVLVLCLSALAAALLAWQSGRAQMQLREQVLAEAERSAVRLADAMAGQVEGLISLLDVELRYLRHEWQLHGGLHQANDFAAMVGGVLDAMPRGMVAYLALADAQGKVVFNSLGRADAPDVADRPYFQALRAGGDHVFIGQPVRSRLTGEWVVMVARPLLGGGAFAGTVHLAVSTEFLARRLGALGLSPQDVVALIDTTGVFLARSLENESAMGQVLPANRPFLQHHGQRFGSFHAAGQIDGTARAYGWHRVGERGLVVSVGLADAGVLAPLAPAIARGQALAAVLSLVLLAGGAGLALLLLRVARSEAQSAAARSLRQRLFDHSEVAMVVLEPRSFRLIECNDAAVRAYGFRNREDTLGRNAMEVSAPLQRDGRTSIEAGQHWVARAIGEHSVTFEWLHQRPDGTQWDAEVHLMRFEADGRELLQFTLLDITARRHAEAALKASEARLKEAQRIAHVGSWEIDLRNNAVSWSDQLFRIFEMDPATQVPSYARFIELVHPDDRAMINRTYRVSVEGRVPHDVVHRLLMPDGRVKHVRQVGFTEFDGETAVRTVGTVQDITAMREAEDALRRLNEELEDRVAERTRELSLLNRELEAFAYSVSHDLRTPLRTINGYASLLHEDLGERLDAGTRGHLERIRQAANRMGQIIDAMLSLARVNRGELQPALVDLSAMARVLAAELAADEPARVVRWQIDEGLRAWADPDLMHVALQNLMGNAWKYTRRSEAAEIRVQRLDSGDDEDAFCVVDNGAGFDMRYAHQLFEPFKRLHGPHEFEGNGVGLATVKRVVERHGGWLRGEGDPGRGARFCIGLPRRGAGR